jgi:predicted nucleic acid-binding protein
LTPVQPEDYLSASDLGRAYKLFPNDALHLSVMRREHISDIASRDRDFEGIDGIRLWSP